MNSSSPIAPISSLPSTPYSRSRISMQRACDVIVRLQSYHDKLIGSPPGIGDEGVEGQGHFLQRAKLARILGWCRWGLRRIRHGQRLLFRLEEALGTA